MNDNILNAGLLALMVTMAVAAAVSPDRSARVSAADMPVVMLPAVEVAGKRQAPADHMLAAAAKAAPQVVQLPPVAVSGRRVPALETVTLARAQ